MSKQRNAYLAKREAVADARLARQLELHTQIAADAAAIAANDCFHMGPSRAEEHHKAFRRAYMDIVKLINGDIKGDDYAFIKLDERIKSIFGDKFVPYQERYGRK